MERTKWIIVWFALLALTLGMTAVLSCGDDDDDDDDSGTATDDDDDYDDDSADDVR